MIIKKIIILANIALLCLLTLSPNLEASKKIDITITPDKAEDYVIEEKATFDIEMARRNRPVNIKLKQIEAAFPNEEIPITLTKVSKGKFKYISEEFEETGEKTLSLTVRSYGAVRKIEMLERSKERLERRIEKLEERKENTNNERLKRILDKLIAKCQRSIQKIDAKIEKTREKGIIGEASLTINVIPIAPPPEVPESGHIYGNVYDSVTELPIYEVVIIVEGIEGGVSTDNEGRFRFPISEFEGDFRDAKLLIQKDGYISVTRNISVVSERDVTVGDIYLKEVDPVVTEITPAGGEATDSTETVKIIFPPDAVSEPVDIVITPYEDEKELPHELPAGTSLLRGTNVDANGVVFTEPVTVELPNDKGFAPGTLIPIGRYDEEIEEWVHETMAVVSADGTKLIYQTTHFSPQAAGVTTETEDGGSNPHVKPDNDKAPDDPFQPEPGVYAGLRMGNLAIDHTLPAVKYLGKTEALNFHYQTETVNPRPRISMKIKGPSGGAGKRPIPETFGFDISIGDEKRHVVFETQPGWYKQSYMFDARDGDGNLLPTGSYPYSANTSNDYNAVYCLTDEFGGPPLASTGIPTDRPVSLPMLAPGRVEIQNETNSPFGAGWNIEGLQRMHFDPDGTILITNGDGSMDIFAAGEEVAKGFGVPAYIAINPEGDIIVTDPFISQMTGIGKSEVITVVRIKPDGTKTKVVDLERPTGVVYDAFGNLYIASARFPKYDASGNPISGTFPTILIIDPLGGTTELSCPAARPGALAIDALNNLYVADLIMGRICKITPLGQVSIFAKGFNLPGEMKFDASGNLYVANGLKSGISKITPSGEKTVILRGIKKAGGLEIASDGKILVTGIEKGVIYRVDPIAETYEIIASGFMHPAGIAIKGDEIIVGNASHGVLSKIRINGEIKGYAGPNTDYSTLTKNVDETYARRDKYGAKTVFNKDGLQIKKIDRNNNITSYAYIDANGDSKVEELSAITLPIGQNYTFTYDDSGKLSSITDPANRVTQFAIDGENNLTQITNSDGTTRTFDYAGHLLTAKTDERGNISEYTYDETGKLKKVILPERDVANVNPDTGEVTVTRERPTHTYGPSIVKGNTNDLPEGVGTEENPAPTVALADITDDYTDSEGNPTIYKTDRYGKIIEKTDALGNFTKTDRDRSGYAREIARANGSIVEMSYDEKGNLLTSTDKAIDATTTFTYESDFNQVASITDPEGNTTQHEYDAQGNLVKIIDAENNETVMTYDTKGLLISTTDAKGNITIYTYDANGNLIKIIDALNNETSFTYDSAGNVISSTDAKDNVTTYEYNQMSRLLKLTDSQGNITSYEYDQAGNRAKIIDPKDNTTAYEYNEMSQLVKVTDAEDNVTTYTYDENNNRASIADANSNTTCYVYNEVDQLIKVTDPLNKVNSYTYDEMGSRISATDSNDNAINYTYDLLSRLTQTTYPDASSVSFTYDKAGKRLSMTDAQGMTTYVYDNLNRLIGIDGPESNDTISYNHDALGNRTSMTNQDVGTTAYTYDSLNRLINLTDPGNNITSYIYDETSNLVHTEYPNNTQVNYTFDNLNRLINLTNSSQTETISSYAYDYDPSGMRTKVTLDNGDYINYNYDALNQLTSEIKKDLLNTIQYSYNYGFDNVGNRLSMTKDGVTTNYSYNESNQLLSSADGITYTYDNNGNLISKTDSTGTTNYSWDYENRLVGIQYADGTSDSYVYDGVGKRIQTSENGLVKNYLYDGLNCIIEQDGTGLTTAKYVRDLGYGGGIGSIISANESYYYYDGVGNVINKTDNVGNVTQSLVYDAYGNILNSVVPSPHGFSTKEYSSRSGLIYFGARYYDPEVGRWISKDPWTWAPDDPRILAITGRYFNPVVKNYIVTIGSMQPQRLHFYMYVFNNPVNLIDPWGLCKSPLEKFADFLKWLSKVADKVPTPGPTNIAKKPFVKTLELAGATADAGARVMKGHTSDINKIIDTIGK